MRATAAKLARPLWAVRVERLRNGLGLSQTEFARKLDVSAMAVSRWERGVNEPPARSYLVLGKLCGGAADSWYFWERAGISKQDVKRLLKQS
jgi:transcriptional regulator with XRE-family HTH domain